jgi:hypothetical protein
MPVRSAPGVTGFLNCPRCGLSIRVRGGRPGADICPRCVGRAHLAIRLVPSVRPPADWHRDGPAPDSQGRRVGRG